MDIQGDIRTWLLKQQDWLQEAADRLLKNGLLTQEDIADLASHLKTAVGQAVTKHRPLDELMHDPEDLSEIRLARIDGVTGIESLGPRKPLDFGGGNLTVIYGHNGSGKSSYTRILKKVSGKPRASDLKPNVFQDLPAESKCQISYSHNGLSQSPEWLVGSPPIDALRQIDIFDSDEAGHYLRGESAASYTPPVVGLFEKLAVATDKIKELLQTEQAKLTSALPAIPALYQQTQLAQTYGALHNIRKASDLEKLLEWTDLHTQSLNALIERLKADDPDTLAKQKRRTKTQIEQIITSLSKASNSYSVDNLNAVRKLRDAADGKRKIANEAAQVKSAVLDGVGSATWQALWEAARNYSATPYPAQPFPVTEDARCVLCHQELQPEAQLRLLDFESFVQGKLERDAKQAETLHTSALDDLPATPTEQQIQTQCEAAGLTAVEWKEYLLAFWGKASAARTALISHELIDGAFPVDDAKEKIIVLGTYRDQLEASATQLDADVLQFDRVKANGEKLELEAKKWVAEQSLAVHAEFERLARVKAYDGWKTLANSRSISLKATDVAEKVVTEAYVARFNRELQALGASRIQVELIKTRTRSAKVLHQLRLKGVKNPQGTPETVLSEGERRIISLAAFLADVADKPGSSPFIFDDPISSLDHDFEWHVACRLVQLAKKRQVLIFTHRLSLYGAMDDVSKKEGEAWQKAHYRPMCIESYAGTSGQPADQEVWNNNTKKANNILLTRLDSAHKAGEAGGAAAYRALAQGICSDFRKLIERSVEEDLLNKVVLRHRRSVTTEGRLAQLHGILPDECNVIDDLMTRYSCFEHSQSGETPIIIPEADALKIDIERLITWRKALSERRAKLIVA